MVWRIPAIVANAHLLNLYMHWPNSLPVNLQAASIIVHANVVVKFSFNVNSITNLDRHIVTFLAQKVKLSPSLHVVEHYLLHNIETI